MTNCPKCGQPVEKESACPTCSRAANDSANSTDAAPEVSTTSTAGAPGPRKSRASLLLIALVVCGGGSLMLLASATRTPATPPDLALSAAVPKAAAPAVNAAAAPVVATAPIVAAAPAMPAIPADVPRSTTAPRWIASAPLLRGRAAANGIVFELAADEDVKVWRNRVRPVLTVRCAAKTTEVFVMTHSAASVEGNTSLHTVQVAFDGGDAPAQMWEHSVDHDALFAPDGSALVRQIAGARRMTFAFTPFNASPAVASFSVAGFEAQRQSAAKACGGKR